MKIKNVTILYWMAASEKQTLKSGHTVSLADGHGLMNWWEIADCAAASEGFEQKLWLCVSWDMISFFEKWFPIFSVFRWIGLRLSPLK